MITVIYGPATQDDLDLAELMAGITPTSFVTDGRKPIQFRTDKEVCVVPWEPKLSPELAERQNHARLAMGADAMICKNAPESLLMWAANYELPVYQA